MSLKGTGWVFLVDDEGHLELMTAYGNGSPAAAGRHITPLLALDVWEHAYWNDFDSVADYVRAWFSCVHWPAVEQQLAAVPPEYVLLD